MGEKQRLALVTGGGKRVGKIVSKTLAACDYELLIHYNHSQKEAEETANELKEEGVSVNLLKADFRSQTSLMAMIAEIKDRFERLDLLVNSASVFTEARSSEPRSSFLQQSWNDWEDAVAVDARAAFFLIQGLYSLLAKSGSGLVINLLDTSISSPYLSRPAHTIAKRALQSITELCAQALFPEVRVNAIELGYVLPTSELTEDDKRIIPWVSSESVSEAFREIIRDVAMTGAIIRVKK